MDKQCADKPKNCTNQCNGCSRGKPTGPAAGHQDVYYLGDLSMGANSGNHANQFNPNLLNKKCNKNTEPKKN